MRLRAGLELSGARLENHRTVITHADAVRWLLEQIAAAGGPAIRETK